MATVTRRAVVCGVSAAIALGRFRLFGQGPAYTARAMGLVQETATVDLLNQFRFQDFAQKPPKIDRWLDRAETFTKADAEEYLGSGTNVFALGAGASDYEGGLRFFAK